MAQSSLSPNFPERSEMQPGRVDTIFHTVMTACLAALLMLFLAGGARAATTALADQPFITTVQVPGNVALMLSVEYPTATSIGNGIVAYSSSTTYYGYFDPGTCYYYNQVTTKTSSPSYGSYFSPYELANSDHSCTGATTNNLWSGNFLNWAAFSTIDPFRWALTGGYRSVDTSTLTILEKSWSGSQAGYNETPPQETNQSTYSNLTPFSSTTWTNIWTNIHNMGQYMCFSSTALVDGGVTTSGTWTTPRTGSWLGTEGGTLGGTYVAGTSSSNPDKVTGAASYSTSSTNWSGTLNNATEYSSGASVTASQVYCTEIRVKVCDPTATTGVESNCYQFPNGNYKPQGLIQKYSQQMRFADFGYLLDSASSSSVGVRDGGVMRARMEFVGPTEPVPGSASITNPNAEWNSSTGVFIANPDTTDTTNTLALTGCSGGHCTIPNSGVINYLNMFGEHARSLGHTSAYKGLDNVSELYYTALRYYKELGNVPEYTALTAINTDLNSSDCVTASVDQCVDGFPVITNWYPSDTSAPRGYDFPIQYACQKNFVVGIGDANTHQDGNLPGIYASGGAELSNPGKDSTFEPTLETLVSSTGGTACTSPSTTPCSDTTVDTTKATDWIGYQEGTVNSKSTTTYPLGENTVPTFTNCCGGATYYIAGLAYDAHVHDMLPNDFQTNGVKSQTQTLTSYFVDVLEYGTFYNQNQYWMAAKYGGFQVPTGYTEYCSPVSGSACNATTAWPTSMWASLNRVVYNGSTAYTVPDNYYSGRDSAAMVSGLSNAFAQISAAISATTTALSLSTPQVTSNNNATYAASYDASNWTGQVIGSTLTYDSSGNPTETPVWNARSNLESQVATNGYANGRIIVTWTSTVGDTATGSAQGFEAANLSTTEQSDLTPSTSSATAAQVVNYLRGDRTYEGTATGTLFRTRTYLLGDIVDSKVVAVGAPNALLTNEYNLGYGAFQSTYATRNTVVYAGGNDGMLHAFDGSLTDSTQGKELWAYVPGAVYAGPTATPYVNGIVSRTYKTFTHYNFVDATPVVADVDFDNAGGSFNSTASNWHSILVAGLGKGGMSYYAIDVTNPSAMSSESAVAGKVLWEFSQKTITAAGYSATIGYSFGPPIITKTKKYGWVVILLSGYDNSDGVGYVFFLNPQTGALLEPPLSTSTGSATTPSGLTFATTFVPNYADGTSDALYAGDILGDLWRVDLTPSSGNYAAPMHLASAQDATGAYQPITTLPIVEVSPTTSKRYVLFGTGRTLAQTDLYDTQTNTIYSVYDGTGTSGGFFTSTSSGLPSGTTYPVTRSEMQVVTNLYTGVGANPLAAMGWYMDLGISTTSPYVAEQVDINPVANNGYAAFGINLSNGSACSPSGTGRVISFDVGTGVTSLTDANGYAVTGIQLSTRVTDLAFVNENGFAVHLTIGAGVGTTGNFISANNGQGTSTGGSIINGSASANGANGAPTCNSTTAGTTCNASGNWQNSNNPTKLNWHEIKGTYN